MERLFQAVCTVSVEVDSENAQVPLKNLQSALADSAEVDIDYENSTTQAGDGNIVGISLDWETLTPARKPSIQVWRYEDAPDELKYRSHHGGDEDWVALVPKELVTPDPENLWIPWLEKGNFGNDVQQETLEDGSVLFIAAHA